MQLPDLKVQDIASTIDEGVQGWLTRHAGLGYPQPNARANGVLILSQVIVSEVTAACERWHLNVNVREGRPGWSVVLISGRALPVLAISEVVAALRHFNAC
jgi:hypothetical protein